MTKTESGRQHRQRELVERAAKIPGVAEAVAISDALSGAPAVMTVPVFQSQTATGGNA